MAKFLGCSWLDVQYMPIGVYEIAIDMVIEYNKPFDE